MSDLMLHAVLNIPKDLWDDSEIDKSQRNSRYNQASKLITEQQSEISALRETLKNVSEVVGGKNLELEKERADLKFDNRSLEIEISALRAQVESKWISVEDRLPDEFGDYLVCGNGFMETDYFNELVDEFSYRDDATHWMQLPKTPELLESEK